MDKKSFYELCYILTKLTGIEDVGYHRILSDRLNPIIKSNNGEITEEDWLKHHTDNPALIANNPLLVELLRTKKRVYIKDTSILSSADLDSFTICSVYVFPIVIDDEVIGVIPIVSIGIVNNLKDETILECELAINKYKYIFE